MRYEICTIEEVIRSCRHLFGVRPVQTEVQPRLESVCAAHERRCLRDHCLRRRRSCRLRFSLPFHRTAYVAHPCLQRHHLRPTRVPAHGARRSAFLYGRGRGKTSRRKALPMGMRFRLSPSLRTGQAKARHGAGCLREGTMSERPTDKDLEERHLRKRRPVGNGK